MADNRAIHKFKAEEVFDERYTLERLMGSGGFADVWKAKDKDTNTSIALKIYTNLDDDGINGLAQEYTRMQNLSHTNILKADHFARWGNIPYLVMKVCEGGSLSKKVGNMEDAEIMRVIEDIAEGLIYLHQNKIVHQDIKPANILIDTQSGRDTYVLSDFGISSKTKTRLSHSVNMNSKDKTTSMTTEYAPPEKFSSKREDRKPDRKGDIFSFGISLYELACGHLPFDDFSTGRELLHSDVEVDFSEIKDEKLRRIIKWCMQPNKDDRPTAEQLLQMVKSGDMPEDRKVTGHGKHTVRVSDSGSSISKYLWIFIVMVLVGGGVYWLLNNNFIGGSTPVEEGYVQKVDTFTINGIRLEMIKIPGGTFTMGCSDSNDASADANEKPAKIRQVSDFYMGKYEVTQKLWSVIMNSNPSTSINDNYPVNNVSWDDCQLFIQRLNAITGRNFRLPTETEWEYAAKAILKADGTGIEDTGYKYAGTSSSLSDYAWYSSNSGGVMHAVGSKKPNDFGLYDMSGNVIEWCQDIYTNYNTGSPEIDKDQRVLRGGYYAGDAGSVRCTSRGSCDYTEAMEPFGFRLCLQ